MVTMSDTLNVRQDLGTMVANSESTLYHSHLCCALRDISIFVPRGVSEQTEKMVTVEFPAVVAIWMTNNQTQSTHARERQFCSSMLTSKNKQVHVCSLPIEKAALQILCSFYT